MIEKPVTLPNEIKEAELGKFRVGEPGFAYVHPSALIADASEKLWINSTAIARGTPNSDFCVSVKTLPRKDSDVENVSNLPVADRLAIIDLSGCSDENRFVREGTLSSAKQTDRSPNANFLPVVRINGADGKQKMW